MKKNKQTIHYTVLAKSIPEYNKKRGDIYTCCAGWSPELGLIRLYPLPITGMRSRGTYRIEIERNKEDSRKESWKMSMAARDRYFNFQAEKHLVGFANKGIYENLLNYIYPSIESLNRQKKSLGVIRVNAVNLSWEKNNRLVNVSAGGLFSNESIDLAEWSKYTKETLDYQARIVFKDADGTHNIQYNDWGSFMWQRNVLNGTKDGNINDCFRFNRKPGDYLILVGNMFQYRNRWMAFTVIKTPPQLPLFPY